MMTMETLSQHAHTHTLNRFAVIPTAQRLGAAREYTGRGVTIALLDSGFYPHPDLTEPHNRILAFEDLAQPGASLRPDAPREWDWHGTQTSVAAAGNGHLSEGVYRGIASDARVVLVKASDQGRITEANIARGIEWVIAHQKRYSIRVLSISLGGDADVPYQESIVDRAAEEAVRRGITVVAAAGNSGCTERHHPTPPANSPSVITVGGYDDKNRLGQRDYDLYCSSFGPTADGFVKPEILAPAIWVAAPILPGTAAYRKAESLSRLAAAPDYLLSNLAQACWQEAELPRSLQFEPPETIRAAVESLLWQSKIVATHYQHVDGTSFAAPIVAAVIAQMLEANPHLTPAAIKHLLVSTADRLHGLPIRRQGYGVLNARRAVEEARGEMHALDAAGFTPPRLEAGRLHFTYHNDGAASVALAAEFNDWDPARIGLLKDADGWWRANIVAPPPGRYRYKFVVDGGRWVDDPSNGLKELDEHGGFNSVLSIS
jgi:serine protease AprX